MDIVLTIEDIHTLANIIIIDLTCADLVLRITFSKGMAKMIVVETKVVSYHDQHPKDNFIPLAIEIFGCLH
jgi:hypothetical protein